MKEGKTAIEKEQQDAINQIEVIDPIIVSEEKSPRNHHDEVAYEIEDVMAMRNEIIKLQEQVAKLNEKLSVATRVLGEVKWAIVPDAIRKGAEIALKLIAE